MKRYGIPPAARLVVRLRAFIVLLWIVGLLKGQAAPNVIAEFPFQFREGLLWVEVNIPQSEKPLNFLVDTGAGVSVINLSASKRIGLKLGRRVSVHSVESSLSGYWQEPMTAKVGGVQLPSDFLALDLGSLSSSCEHPVDGLVGVDFFRGRVVQIDFDSQKIRILRPEKTGKSDEALQLQLRPCGMRVPINVNGHNHQWVRLDTGCGSALQWVTSDVDPDKCERQVAIGLSEISIPQAETTVKIGIHRFEKVVTGLHESPIFPGEAGLLGNGLLSRFSSITIDAKTGRLILKPRRSAN